MGRTDGALARAGWRGSSGGLNRPPWGPLPADAAAARAGLSGAGLSPEQALSQVNRLIDQQAFMLAANDVFYASALIFLALIPFVWLSHPQRNSDAAGAAAGAH